MENKVAEMENKAVEIENKAVEIGTEKNVSEKVLRRINTFKESGEIKIPAGYSPGNALKSAWLILQEAKDNSKKPVLDVCTKESVANALFDMVIQGLSPIKKQCYFVPYDGKLTLSRSYMGTALVAKRDGNVKSIQANVIYEKDEFDFEIDVETGNKKITRHKQSLESFGSKVAGAYAILTFNDNSKYIEIMSIGQIQASWGQGAMKGNSPAHRNFADEMAKKTVINRACKLVINTSSDAIAMDEDDDYEALDRPGKQVRHEITDNANQGAIIDMAEIAEAAPEPVSKLVPKQREISTQIVDTNSELIQQAFEDPF